MMLKMFMKNKKGFTLVELMVVVVIIGILTAIAVPVYNSATGNAARNACWANQRTLEGLASTYRTGLATPAWPANVAALVTAGYLNQEPRCGANYYHLVDGEVVGTGATAGGTGTTFACGHTHY